MSLQVWLPLNGDLNNQGLLGPLTQTTSPTFTDNGKIGKALSGGGCSMSAEQTAQVLNNNEVSISCWIYPNATTGTSGGILFGTEGMGANNNRKFSIFLYPTINDLHLSWQNDTTNTTFFSPIINGVFPSNKWTHLTIVYHNPNVYIYLNGELYRTDTNIISNSSTFAYNTTVIHNSNTRAINDFRIYNHALSAKEVKEISKGLVLHFPLHGGEGGTNLIKGIAECTATSTGSETLGGPLTYDTSLFPLNSLIGKTFIFSYDYSVEGPKANATGDYSKDRFGSHLTLTYKDASGNAGTAYPGTSYLEASGTGRAVQVYTCSSTWSEITNLTIALQPYNKPASGNNNTWYIKNFKIEVGDIDTGYSINPNTLGLTSDEISDCSGYGHTGTKVLTSYVKNSPRYNASCAMLGAAADTTSNTLTGASYITAKIPLAASSAMTVSWWGKIVKYGRGGIFETTAYEWNPTNGTDFNTTAFANWDSTFSVCNGTSRVNLYSDLVKVDSKWYLHTITYDGSDVKYYRDGTLISTNPLAGTLPAITAIKIGIGRAGGVYRQIQQYVSDFRMYVTALSASDVKELYQIPISIDKSGNAFAMGFIEDQKPEFHKNGIVENNYIHENETNDSDTLKTFHIGKTKIFANQILEV